MQSNRFTGILIVVLAILAPAAPAAPGASPAPRLILQVTVDQLRGDLPGRYRDDLGEGGFRYLMEKGTWYVNANYQHANTETAVGHATLATGADPSRHGIVANDWIDQKTGAFVYHTEDKRHHIIGRKTKAHEGVSPRNLLASTISDELVVHNGGRTRAFSVSVKDRGAILPGGHVGKAFWFSKSTGEFVTSTYYYVDYPQWVKQWNAAKPADAYRNKSWKLLNDRATYIHGQMDDRPYEADLKPLGRTFPHPLGGETKHFYLFLTLTPFGDALTLDFSKALIENEKLGQNSHGAPDYLQISFSSTDYVGHLFGASSLEAEDNLLRLDRAIADLLAFVDAEIGLDRTVVVLTHAEPTAAGMCYGLRLGGGHESLGIAETQIKTSGMFLGQNALLVHFHDGRDGGTEGDRVEAVLVAQEVDVGQRVEIVDPGVRTQCPRRFVFQATGSALVLLTLALDREVFGIDRRYPATGYGAAKTAGIGGQVGLAVAPRSTDAQRRQKQRQKPDQPQSVAIGCRPRAHVASPRSRGRLLSSRADFRAGNTGSISRSKPAMTSSRRAR